MVLVLEPDGDQDGDGYTNKEGHDSGTNPLDNTSFPEETNSNIPWLPIMGALLGVIGLIAITVTIVIKKKQRVGI